tara:strand:- start:133 stop:507 length:375 start_codon:yes stop_codon:yes gene_type:complete
MNKRGGIELQTWTIAAVFLALFVIVGLFVKINDMSSDTKTVNIAKATEIGYAIDTLATAEGDAVAVINLERKTTFTLKIEDDKLTISDEGGKHTYDLNINLDPYEQENPKQITITKKADNIEVA